MAKKLIVAQIVFILLTMLAGWFLRSGAFESARDLHRILAMVTGLVAIFAAVTVLTQKAKASVSIPVIISTLGVIAAGVGGRMTKTDFETGFAVMTIAAAVAFITAIIALVQAGKMETPAS